MRKSQAFTLAEVLITLVIIGVIAAMTIPTLMGNTNDQEKKSALKKAFSQVAQAVKLDMTLYGTKPDCGVIGNQGMARMLKNHMSVIEDNYNGNNLSFKTADGMIYTVQEGVCDQVWVDYNGEKGNHEYGVDVFPFWIYQDSGKVHFDYNNGDNVNEITRDYIYN